MAPASFVLFFLDLLGLGTAGVDSDSDSAESESSLSLSSADEDSSDEDFLGCCLMLFEVFFGDFPFSLPLELVTSLSLSSDSPSLSLLPSSDESLESSSDELFSTLSLFFGATGDVFDMPFVDVCGWAGTSEPVLESLPSESDAEDDDVDCFLF